MAFCWAKKCRDNTVQLPNLRYCDHECSKHKLILKPGFQVAILQATPWAIPYLLSSYRVRTHPRLHLAIPRWTWLVDAWSSCDLVVRKSTESANLIPSWAWWQLHRSPTRRCCPPMAILCCLFFFNGQSRSRQKCTPCDRKIPMAYVPLPKRLAAEKLIYSTTTWLEDSDIIICKTCVETISWLLSIDFWQSDLRQTRLTGKEFLHPTSSLLQACCLSVRSNFCLLLSLHNVCFELFKHMPCALLQGQCGNASYLDDFCDFCKTV